jgi:hypothetical protein
MWVNAGEKGKNKEKCVKRGNVPDTSQVWSLCPSYQTKINLLSIICASPQWLKFLIGVWNDALKRPVEIVRADCLATNTEYCDRCTHAATQATNVARIKTKGTKGLLQGQVAG